MELITELLSGELNEKLKPPFLNHFKILVNQIKMISPKFEMFAQINGIFNNEGKHNYKRKCKGLSSDSHYLFGQTPLKDFQLNF